MCFGFLIFPFLHFIYLLNQKYTRIFYSYITDIRCIYIPHHQIKQKIYISFHSINGCKYSKFGLHIYLIKQATQTTDILGTVMLNAVFGIWEIMQISIIIIIIIEFVILLVRRKRIANKNAGSDVNE